MTVRSSGGPGLAHGLGPVQIGVCPKSSNSTTRNNQDVLLDGKLTVGLGLEFAICKGMSAISHGIGSIREYSAVISADLIAICCLVESAKANVIECEQEQDLLSESSYNAQ